ncbi:hypothetical protein V6Z12_D04G130600 [Gossypium hirsutum]
MQRHSQWCTSLLLLAIRFKLIQIVLILTRLGILSFTFYIRLRLYNQLIQLGLSTLMARSVLSYKPKAQPILSSIFHLTLRKKLNKSLVTNICRCRSTLSYSRSNRWQYFRCRKQC